LAKLSVGVALAIAVLLAVLILLFGLQLAEMLSLESISSFFLLIPIFMLFSAFNQILEQWLIRKQQFKITASISVLQALTLNIAKAGVGCFHPVGGALIALATLGSLLHTLLLWLGLHMRATTCRGLAPEDAPGPQRLTMAIKYIAHKHRDFPLYRAPQVAINALSQSLPVLMLASFFGPASAGFYVLGKTVMGVPSALIGKAVGDVLYPKVAEAKSQKNSLSSVIEKSTLMLFLVGVIPSGFVMLMGPWLFGVIFGLEWRTAGEYAQWLSLFFLFNFINKPSVVSIPVLGIQGGLLIYEIFSTGIKVVGLVVGFYYFNSDKIAIALFSIFGCLAYLWLIIWVVLSARRIEKMDTQETKDIVNNES